MSHNTWLHRLARPLVRPFVKSPVTPNHLTTFRLLSGIAAAGCFGAGESTADITGVLLFVLSMILDRADGELARLQGSGSAFGGLYDISTDALVNTAVLLGLGVAASQGPLGDWAIAMSLVAGLCISIIFTLVFIMETRHGTGSTAFRSYAGFDPDDAMLAVPAGVLLGIGDVLVVLAVVCSPLAVFFVYRELGQRA